MRHAPTDAENKLWSLLRAKRLAGHKFKRQEQLGDYIVDFVCFASRLVVEVDGSQHCESPTDAIRDTWLQDEGFRVVRFWNNEVLSNPDGVREKILECLQQ